MLRLQHINLERRTNQSIGGAGIETVLDHGPFGNGQNLEKALWTNWFWGCQEGRKQPRQLDSM